MYQWLRCIEMHLLDWKNNHWGLSAFCGGFVFVLNLVCIIEHSTYHWRCSKSPDAWKWNSLPSDQVEEELFFNFGFHRGNWSIVRATFSPIDFGKFLSFRHHFLWTGQYAFFRKYPNPVEHFYYWLDHFASHYIWSRTHEERGDTSIFYLIHSCHIDWFIYPTGFSTSQRTEQPGTRWRHSPIQSKFWTNFNYTQTITSLSNSLIVW